MCGVPLGSVLDGLPVAGQAGATLAPEWGRFDNRSAPDARDGQAATVKAAGRSA